MISKLFFFIFFFCALNFSAQSSYDTVYFSGNKFVKHIVRGGESLKSIANLHKVKTLEVKKANELDKRLFYNQVLYIPIYLSAKDEELLSVKKLMLRSQTETSSITNIALLMPYYLLKNDTMFNNNEAVLDRYYSNSESALSFHVGVELAIDSLRRAGKNIVLHIFDTNQDSIEVKRIVYSNRLDDMDIIIGPMYSNLFQIMCRKYGQDTTKILVNPLSRDNKSLMKFSSVYQVAITYKVQAEILTQYLIDNKIDERIIIFSDLRERGLAAYLKHKFQVQDITVESFEVMNTDVDMIRKYFVENQNVLLISKNKAFISKMLGSIGSIDSTSTVFTFESISLYENLDIANLLELDAHIPNSRSIDFSNDYDSNFTLSFENKFGTNVRKYSKVGYDIIMHFCGNAFIFDFKKYEYGYYENISAPIFHYVDYELVPVN